MDIEPGLFHKFDSTAVENIIEPKVGKHQMGSRDRVQAQGLRSSSGTGAILPRRKTIMPPSMSGSPLSTRRHRRDSDAARSTSLENSGVPDDRFTSVSRMSYTGGRFVSDASVPPSVLAAQASEAKQHFLRTGDARRSQGRMADRRV